MRHIWSCYRLWLIIIYTESQSVFRQQGLTEVQLLEVCV